MPDVHADTIIVAGRVRTMVDETDADAIAIADGRVLAVGPREAIDAFAGPETRTVELPHATVVPGLVDAHTHPVYSLGIVRGAAFTGLTDYDEFVAALRSAAANQQGQEWFYGWGLDPNAFEGRPVSNAVLTEVLGAGRPAYIRMFDAHSALVSDAALQRAGIRAAFANEDGSAAVADDTGTLTGHVLEFAAMELVEKVMPPTSFDDRRRQLSELLADMAAHGLTGTHVQDLEDPDALELLAAIEAEGELPIRLRLSPWCKPSSTDDEVEALAAAQGSGGRRYRVEGIKFFIDGTVEGGTAWLDSPDARGQGTASTWSDPDAYAARIRFFHDRGITTQTHAIGDHGIRFVAQTLAALPANGTQHRIEHIESVDGDVIELIGANGIAASMQPTHCTHYVRADGGDDWSKRLGPQRAARAWRMADVRRAGAVLALGSDWPVAAYDPWEIMADARLRRPVDHPEVAPVAAGQALSARQCLEGYTTHAHRSIGRDSGTLDAGADADLAVIDVDPVECAPEQLARARVLLTVVGGAIAFDGRDGS